MLAGLILSSSHGSISMWMISACSQAHQSAGHRRADALRKLQHQPPGIGPDDAAADVKHRAARLGDERGHARDLLLRTPFRLRGPTRLGPGFHVANAQKNILGNIHHHGAGASGLGDLKRARDHFEKLLRVHRHEAVLGDGEREPKSVHLLEGVGAEQRAGDLPGDGHQRHAVELGVGDGREEIRRARPGGAKADGGPARHARHALRDEPRALFMPREDVPDGAVVKRVVKGQNGAAGNAGEHFNALAFE